MVRCRCGYEMHDCKLSTDSLTRLIKMEAKGALLVRGPWDETPSSPGLPFKVNRSQSFPRVY